MELQDTNDIYMKMNIAILSNEVNFNNAQFTPDFIDGVIENQEKYVGIPFLVNREKIENGEYDDLTHELNTETGELGTDQIGSFVSFWKEEVDGANCLMGSIKIFKRFKQTCEAITTLVANNTLETSCEVLINDYEEITEEGVRKIHYNDGKNSLFGSSIVTNGAESRAKPTLLIAEAYKKDINSHQQGGDKVTKEKYNNGIKVRYHGRKELFSMQIYDIEEDIYNKLNPVDVKNGGRDYNYYIYDLYNDKVIIGDGDNLFSAKYKVENSTVILDEKEDWVKGSFEFVPEGVTVAELMEQNDSKIAELEKEVSELKEEKETMSKKKDLTVEELNEKIKGLETEIFELKEKNTKLEETIVSQKEESVKQDEKAQELNTKIKELAPFKEQVEKAETDAKIAELNDKFSKLLDEEAFKSEEVSKAINELDETALNSIVVAEIAKKKVTETASKSGDVIIEASKKGDLLEPTITQKYGLD